MISMEQQLRQQQNNVDRLEEGRDHIEATSKN
jgi:hypothetical protein